LPSTSVSQRGCSRTTITIPDPRRNPEPAAGSSGVNVEVQKVESRGQPALASRWLNRDNFWP
jgi:hypothetical protein